MSSPVNNASRIFPAIPRGEVIGRYENYLDAQKVVDYLADNDFPVSNVSIIGNDLKQVERVRAKLSYPRVAGQGALQGALIGLFFGLLLSIFGNSAPGNLAPIMAGVLLGAVLFMLMNVVSYAMQRGKRDFASTSQVLPSSYDVVVEFSVANQAKQLAAKLPMHPSQAEHRTGWGQGSQGGAGTGTGAPQSFGAPTPQQPVPGAEQHEPSTPTTTPGFGDLDDGRPRYGVRLEEMAPPAAPAPSPVHGETAPGAATEPAPISEVPASGPVPASHSEAPQASGWHAAVPQQAPEPAEPPVHATAPAAEDISTQAMPGVDPSGSAPEGEAPLSRREARALEEREQQERQDRERASQARSDAEPATQAFQHPEATTQAMPQASPRAASQPEAATQATPQVSPRGEAATQALPTLPVHPPVLAPVAAPSPGQHFAADAPAAAAAEDAAEEDVAPIYPPIQPPAQGPVTGQQTFGVAPPLIQAPAAPPEDAENGQDQQGGQER